ncbi:MAG TPA: ATP-binding protein [Candidatus Melainabacteria bacterium]|nr:ATP-binding protein [Candidatus Melainabacteria bacterium]
MKLKASEKHLCLDIQVATDLIVEADTKELAKLLHHLMENAIKFARSRVVVSAAIIGHELAISIEDDGTGIAGEDLPHIFDRFYLLSSQGNFSAMTGIGLCLCAEIVRAHNGQIKCDSRPGQGTKFTVLLPQPAN